MSYDTGKNCRYRKYWKKSVLVGMWGINKISFTACGRIALYNPYEKVYRFISKLRFVLPYNTPIP